MPNSNTQIVQDCYAAFGRGDIPAILDMLAEDVIWTNPGQVACLPTAGNAHGRAGVANFFQTVAATWNFATFEPREFVEAGDTVAALGTYTPVSLATGKSVVCEWCMVWKIRASDGKIVRFQEYTDTQALVTALTPAGATAAATP